MYSGPLFAHLHSLLAVESTTKRLADSIGFELLGAGLAEDVEASLSAALKAGGVFSGDPLSVFRETLTRSIREMEQTDKRVDLLQRFLRDMSYDWGAERRGESPNPVAVAHLDEELAEVVNFISGHMLNRFQGGIAELLGAAPCQALMENLQQTGQLPFEARLYAGHGVTAAQARRSQKTYAADFYILVRKELPTPVVTVVGVVEVKSFHCCTRILTKEIREQIEKHLARAHLGLRFGDADASCDSQDVSIGLGKNRPPVKVVVVPDRWRLPRTFRFQEVRGGRVLRVDPGVPATEQAAVSQLRDGAWRITLRWSEEALAQAAYDMAFWYMGKLGEAIYATKSPWPHMSPAEAGRNASKMMLSLAVGRLAHDRPAISHGEAWRQYQLAIGLYNAFNFGCALGLNFRSEEDGGREILYPEDLDEILEFGRTTYHVRDPETLQPIGPERHCRIM